jgi:hypothetical protein
MIQFYGGSWYAKTYITTYRVFPKLTKLGPNCVGKCEINEPPSPFRVLLTLGSITVNVG